MLEATATSSSVYVISGPSASHLASRHASSTSNEIETSSRRVSSNAFQISSLGVAMIHVSVLRLLLGDHFALDQLTSGRTTTKLSEAPEQSLQLLWVREQLMRRNLDRPVATLHDEPIATAVALR